MKNNEFNPNRLAFARKRRKLTIRKLSTILGITSQTLSNYENGRSVPDNEMVSIIAEKLQFPNRFFCLSDIELLNEKSISFRSFARMPAYVRYAALCAGGIALELTDWLEKRFEFPSVDLPDLRDYDPESAAETIRKVWGLGERSVHNMIHILEAKGIRVFSLSEDTFDMDAYSFWNGERAFIFLNTKKSVEHGRFDAAHELGHLVLHKHGSPAGKEVEQQANRFASAFLMPKGSIVANAPHFHVPTIGKIISLKPYWRVSASALIRRLKDLELISEWHYNSMVKELSWRGYMKNEPSPITERETSKLLPLILKDLRESNITKKDIASELCYPTDEINQLVFNLDTPPHLRVIK